jgi:hypothetical protein
MDQHALNFGPRSRFTLSWWMACVLSWLLLLVATAPGIAQNHPVSPSLPTLPSGAPANARQDYDIPSRDFSEEARRLRAINLARQHEMASDANKLVKLTNELNAELVRSKSETMTRAQLRKLGEIEKLAHDIKQKMSELQMVTAGPQASDIRP